MRTVVAAFSLWVEIAGSAVRLTDLSYEDWLEHAFGREVRIQQAAWVFDHDCDWWDPEPAVVLAYLTRLFEHPEPALRWYSDSQNCPGINLSCQRQRLG
jgi:hypothetical protein